jgi:hypothetical protein
VATPAAKPPVNRRAAAPAPTAKPARQFGILYVIIPVLGVLGVGVIVGWEMFRAQMEQLQQGQGAEHLVHPSPSVKERRSRELKAPDEPKAVEASKAVAAEDELVELGRRKKTLPAKPAAPLPPVERAWRSVKSDFDKLEQHSDPSARKYRLRMLSLEDRKGSMSEPMFLKEAAALEAELKAELAKPENQ